MPSFFSISDSVTERSELPEGNFSETALEYWPMPEGVVVVKRV